MAAPPRICVLSSGLARVYKSCADIVKKQIGLPELPIDYYALFWDMDSITSLQDYTLDFRSSTLWSSPQRDFSEFPDINKAPETKLQNFFSMCYGRWLLAKTMRENGIWDNYDVFLYVRPDVCFDRPIDLAALLEFSNKNYIFLPANGHWRGGFNDQTAWGGRSMEVYLRLFEHLWDYVKEGVLLHPETMLKHHLARSGISVHISSTQSIIFRNETMILLGKLP